MKDFQKIQKGLLVKKRSVDLTQESTKGCTPEVGHLPDEIAMTCLS